MRAYCHGKRRFADELAARLALSTGRDNEPNRTYKCPKCDGWHLTNMPKKVS